MFPHFSFLTLSSPFSFTYEIGLLRRKNLWKDHQLCSVYYNLFPASWWSRVCLRDTNRLHCGESQKQSHTQLDTQSTSPCSGQSRQLCLGTQVISDQPLRVLLPCHLRVPLLGEESVELSPLTMKGELIFSKSAWLAMPKVRREISCKTLEFLNNAIWVPWMKLLWENDLMIILNTGQS